MNKKKAERNKNLSTQWKRFFGIGDGSVIRNPSEVNHSPLKIGPVTNTLIKENHKCGFTFSQHPKFNH